MKLIVKICDIEGYIGWEETCDFVSDIMDERNIDRDNTTARNKIEDEIDEQLERWIQDGDTVYVEFDLEKKKARVLTLKEYEAL